VQKLWDVYSNSEADGPKAQLYYAESLKHLNELSNYRRIRLFTSRGTVPPTLWYLLCSGGIVLVCFTYFFGHESLRAQAAMTAALAGILAFSLFLIDAYDSPYSGAARVAPAPFQLELQHVTARGAADATPGTSTGPSSPLPGRSGESSKLHDYGRWSCCSSWWKRGSLRSGS
jgi:hypothetical protein